MSKCKCNSKFTLMSFLEKNYEQATIEGVIEFALGSGVLRLWGLILSFSLRGIALPSAAACFIIPKNPSLSGKIV